MQKMQKILPPDAKMQEFLSKNNEGKIVTGISVLNLVKRANIDIYKVNDEFGIFGDLPEDVMQELNIKAKYHGYLEIERQQIDRQKGLEDMMIPDGIDYSKMEGLRLEARQKLNNIKPSNVGQASSISGVSPADISILIIYLKKHTEK